MSEDVAQEVEQEPRSVSPGAGCLFTVVIGVLGAVLMLLALSVALRGEARFSKGDLGETDNQGLALSTTRIVDGSESESEVCIRTTARFLMLRSAQPVEDVVFCECFEKPAGNWIAVGECP